MSSEYWLYNEKTKEMKPIIGQNEDEEYEVEFGHSQNEYIVLTNKLSEYRRLYRLRNKKLEPIGPRLESDIGSGIN